MTLPAKEIQLRGDSVLQLPFIPPRSLYGAKLGDLNDVDTTDDTDGHVLTAQPDGSFALEELPSGLGAPEWGDITGTLADQSDLASALAGKAASSHGHAIADTTGLQAALDGKAATSHSHAIADTTGLQAALDGKAATSHSHAIADTTGLQAALDGKAATSHSHAIADTTGLQAALDGKAATSHGHAIVDTTGLQAALDGKAATSHSHAIADTTGLQAALDGKAATSHSHAIADTTGLQAALDAKLNSVNPSITGTLTLSDADLFVNRYGATSAFRFRRANGTPGAETQVLSGQFVQFIGSMGWHSGGAWHSNWGGYHGFVAVENYTSGAQGTDWRLFTVAIGSTTPTERIRVTNAGRVGIGLTAEPTAILDVNGDTIRLRNERTPASAGAAGNKGEICWDTGCLYICTATNTWTKVPIFPFSGIITPPRGVHWASELTATPGGTSATIALNEANHQTLSLVSATGTVTATLTVPTAASASGTILIRQHATTPRGITWAVSAGSIKWLGTQPTWSSDATNSYRVVSWRWNGSFLFLTASASGT
jgi:oxalate decarboxylase/phosphoglucose isomerase-like protein (cupin superfamily)